MSMDSNLQLAFQSVAAKIKQRIASTEKGVACTMSLSVSKNNSNSTVN